MILNHVNLTVDNALETGTFLTQYFGLKTQEGIRMSEKFAILRDEAGMVLTLIKDTEEGPVVYPSSFHIGFIQSSAEEVNAIHARLSPDGHDAPEPSRQHGSWTIYYRTPGGFLIEVLA